MDNVNSTTEMNALIKNHEMQLVYFDSNTCSVSRDFMQKLEQMIAKYPDIKTVKVDIQNQPELSASYGVFTGPVVMLFIHARETVREAGIMSIISLEEKISRYYDFFYGGN